MQMAELEIFGDLESTVNVENDGALVSEYRLEQNYPNPFNPTTQIRFSIPKSTHVTLSIYNMMGQKVRTLIDGQLSAGAHSTQWNGTDDNGALVANAVYFYHMHSELGVVKKKIAQAKKPKQGAKK